MDMEGKSLVHAILYDVYQRPPDTLQIYLKMPTTASLLPFKLEDLEKESMGDFIRCLHPSQTFLHLAEEAQ